MTWFKAAGIRALWTIAQSMIALIGTDAIYYNLEWKVIIGSSLMAGFLSFLKSIVTGLPEVNEYNID